MNTFLVRPRTRCAGRFVSGFNLQERSAYQEPSLLPLVRTNGKLEVTNNWFFLSGSEFFVRKPRPGNSQAHTRQWRCSIEYDMATLFLNAELTPKERKIDTNGSVAPVSMKILEH